MPVRVYPNESLNIFWNCYHNAVKRITDDGYPAILTKTIVNL